MPIDDPAAVHTFIKIMVTSYMDSVSNRPDFIFLTCGHYLYHDNLLPASERHRTVFFFLISLQEECIDCRGRSFILWTMCV